MQILLDIDDTLIDQQKAQQKAATKFGNQYKDIIPNYSKDSFLVLWDFVMIKHFQRFLDMEISFEDQRYYRVLEIFNNPLMNRDKALRIFDDYLVFYEESWVLFSDVIPFLDWCKSKGLKLSIITDGSKKQQDLKLKKTNINHYFDFVFTAEEEQKSKPDPNFFLTACKKLGIKPNKAFYIGDNLIKDAEGASNAGLVGIWINRNNKESSYSGLCIKNLNEMFDIIEK